MLYEHQMLPNDSLNCLSSTLDDIKGPFFIQSESKQHLQGTKDICLAFLKVAHWAEQHIMHFLHLRTLEEHKHNMKKTRELLQGEANR